MLPGRPSPPRRHSASVSPFAGRSPTRSCHRGSAHASFSTSPAPPPPLQGLMMGPLPTATVVTTSIVRATPEKTRPTDTTTSRSSPGRSDAQRRTHSHGSSMDRLSRAGGSSSSISPISQRSKTPTAEEQRELRQARSLFLCGRGLLSLRHIQHLSEMISLRFLSVHMNAIKSLEPSGLCTLQHLVELDLSANELREVPSGCWVGLRCLERLNLSSNLLIRLGPAAFDHLPALQWLSLGFNNLVEISGLRSVPSTAPLAYVDLCSNAIASVQEVTQALALHREHLVEIRLESPSTAAGATVTTASTGTGASGGCVLDDSSASYWQVQENLLCQREDGGSSSPTDAAPSPHMPRYVEALLQFFPRLFVVNGREYGVDPLRALRAAAAAAAATKERTSVSVPQKALCAQLEVHEEEEVSGGRSVDEVEFAELLRKPLPRLPDSPSSDSHSATSPSTSTAGKHRHHHPARSRLTRSRSTKTMSRSGKEAASKKIFSTAAVAAAVSEAVKEATPDSTAIFSSSSSSSQESAHSISVLKEKEKEEAPASLMAQMQRDQKQQRRRRRSATKPLRSGLQRRSSSNSTTASASTSARKPESKGYLQTNSDSPAAVPPVAPSSSNSSSSLPSSSHVRRLQFDSVKDSNGRTSRGSRLGSGRKGSDVQGGPQRLRPVLRAEPSSSYAAIQSGQQEVNAQKDHSPSGITDAQEPSPSPADRVVYWQGGRQRSGTTTTTTPVTSQERLLTRQSTTDSAASSPALEQRGDASRGTGIAAPLSTSSIAAAQRSVGTSPISSSAHVALPWRTKRIARGVCTDEGKGEGTLVDSTATAAAAAAAIAELQRESATRQEQLEAQLALRNATIDDLRQHLDLTRAQLLQLQQEAQHQQRQQRSQITALKDELARRSEEAAILQRKQQAQLNRAVESVKAETARQVEAAEAQAAAEQATTKAAWEEEMAMAREELVQLQQTCTVKRSQVEMLEREVAALTEEIKVRQKDVTTRQRRVEQAAQLREAEADDRRWLEAAAEGTVLVLLRSYTRGLGQLQEKSKVEAQLLAVASQRKLAVLQAQWHVQSTEYQAALAHSMEQIRHLHHQKRGNMFLDTTSQRSASSSPAPVLLITDAATPSRHAPEDHSHTQPAVNPGGESTDDPPFDSALVSTPTPTPPLPPMPPTVSASSAATSPFTEMQEAVRDVVAPHDTDNALPTSVAERVPMAASYWRDACAQAEAQLHRVEAALTIATTAHQSLAIENTRLLTRVTSLEEGQEANVREQQVAAQERANLLRTLHTLRADLEKKEVALDELENEARTKLTEKRQRIAELEEAVAQKAAEHHRAAELNVAYRSQLETAQNRITAQGTELADERQRASTVTTTSAQLSGLEQRHREVSELLATRVAQAHQHELEKRTLVQALTTARDQLVRLHEAHTLLTSTTASAREQLLRLQLEVDTARQQLREAQEVSRAKQRATREVLTQLISSDTL